MTAETPGTPTPGQAAYEAWRVRFGGPLAWSEIGRANQAAWEEIAQSAVTAQQPQPATGFRKALENLVNFWAVGGNGINAASQDLISACSAELLRILDEHPEPQPAPKLAALRNSGDDL